MADLSPRLRMFAGPNGSGKSSLARGLSLEHAGPDGFFQLHDFLNADDLQRELAGDGVDLRPYCPKVDRSNLFKQLQELRGLAPAHPFFRSAKVTHGIVKAAPGDVDSYVAASLVDFIRAQLLTCRRSFTWETVMSHHSKVQVLADAQSIGFQTTLYFIATESPILNIRRVETRVLQGGHDVPPQKIIERYARSLELLPEAMAYATRAFVFDNSGREPVWLAEYQPDGSRTLQAPAEQLPAWFRRFLPGDDLT
jgi:predicted ABC-type ATPase